MARIETWRRIDLDSLTEMEHLTGVLFTQDNQANLIGLELYEGGEPYAGGGSVSANVIRSDGGTVAVTGSISGNKCSILLPQACYSAVGPIFIIVKLTSGSVVTTVGAFSAVVYESSTGTIVDPGQLVSSVQTLINALEEAESSIPPDYSSLWTSLAPSYSSSGIYAVGDYCTHDGYLYECIVPISAPETWTSGHWKKVNVGGEARGIKNAMDQENVVPVGCMAQSSRYIYRGIQYIFDEDGTVTINGTATGGDSSFDIVTTSSDVTLKPGQYTVSGVTGGSTSTYYVYVAETGGSKWNCTNGPVINTVSAEAHFRFAIIVKNGTTVNNVVIKPMMERGGAAHDYKSPVLKTDILYDFLKNSNPAVVMPLSYFSGGAYVNNGISYTLNPDMSITANGTASSDSLYYFVHYDQNLVLKAGNYTLSGCNGGSQTTYELFVADGNNLHHNYGDVCRFKVASDSVYRMALTVRSGVTVSNLTVKPMLEKGFIKHEYMPSRVLNENLYSAIEVMSSTNLMPDKNYSRPSYYRFGVHFLVNDDMSITMNGTATKDAYYMFVSRNQSKEIAPGTYVISGCEGGSNSTYSFTMKLYGNVRYFTCTDSPVIVDVEEQCEYALYLLVKAGTTVEDVTIRPMFESGFIAHAYKSPNVKSQIISVGGENAVKFKNVLRILRQPWTALKNLPYFEEHGYATEDNVYAGIPYSSAFNIGGDVLHQRNLATFFSAVKNPASIIYQPLKTHNGVKVQCNYGIVCTSFTGWMNCQPMQVNAEELVSHGFQFYDYTGIECIAPGDILYRTGHTVMIYDILADQTDLKPLYVYLIQSTTSTWMPIATYTVSEFESILQVNGGAYKLGRYPNRQIRDVDEVRYATDIIPTMGDRTYYYDGDDIYVYIPDTSVTTIYYRKMGVSTWSSVSKSSLSTTTINDTTVYDITNLISELGVYQLTTDTNRYTFGEIMLIDTGSISINGNIVTLSGYCEGLEPVWCQVMGYTSQGGKSIASKCMIDSDTFTITVPSSSSYAGYLVRINYETGYGQAMQESNVVMF